MNVTHHEVPSTSPIFTSALLISIAWLVTASLTSV
jgi:hypothetical protein